VSLAGRRLWFVGIGGAGMSALALVARAWGAEVGGSDRARSPYVDALERAGIGVAIGHRAENVPPGAELVVSTAIAPDNPELVPGVRVRRRAELLGELVSLRPSVVVAGAHGKTTTSGMIAYCADRLGGDPTFLIGGEIPQLGGNARAGSGWLVAEGDESDRTLELLRPRVAVVTNVDLDHHVTFASHAEVAELFEAWLARADVAVRGGDLEPVDLPLSVPGEHNRRNAATALVTLCHMGFDRSDAERVIVEFGGAGRRLERRGEAPLEVWDGAHNLAGVGYLLARLPTRSWTLVVSILADKDAERMLELLAAAGDTLVATRSSNRRALDADDLASVARRFFRVVEPVADPVQALSRARELAGDEREVLVTGSLYLLADLSPSD
jgi:UDP-N-acetylmuramate--alanine ligase